jgi:hypothetical protein
MHPPENFVRVVNKTRHSVAQARLLASDEYWDGHNWERRGRNTFLYRGGNGNYFVVRLTQWEGERDTLEPISKDEAIELYESLQEHVAKFEDAFPGVAVADA